MAWIKKTIPIISAVAFGCIVYFIEPPKSFTDISLFQALLFFGSLSLLLNSLFYLFIPSLTRCLSLSLGVMVLLILRLLDSLNILSGLLVVITTLLIVKYLKKNHQPNHHLARTFKLSRLQKQR